MDQYIYIYVDKDTDPEPDYFLDNYGTCNMGFKICNCMIDFSQGKNDWLGRICPNWKPFGATNHVELKESIEKEMFK